MAIISSAQNLDKNHAKVTALLEFEKEKTTGDFSFVRAPAGGKNALRAGPGTVPDAEGKPVVEWKLSRFKIDIPELDLPSRADN